FDLSDRYFCDIPLPHLMVHLLTAMYGHPCFVNPARTLRITYVAKQTRMYCDAFTLDRCNYLFDLLPTIDIVPMRFQSVAFQLLVRACLDRISWHDWSSSSHPIRGAALASMGEHKLATPIDYEPRIAIQDSERVAEDTLPTPPVTA